MSAKAPKGVRAQKVYARAPIIEAVIDIQVSFSNAPDISQLTECADAIKETFPTRLPINVVRMGMEAKDGKLSPTPTDQQQIGWRLSSVTNDRVLQIQKAGFTYSHMAPYTQWEIFQREARPLWEAYLAVMRPEKITRMATRYINRFEIPSNLIQLEDYFNVTPRAPDSIGPLAAFLVQIQVPQPDIGDRTQAVITVGPSVVPGSPPAPGIMLDIDVSSSEPGVEPQGPKVWTHLEMLRHIKNNLFEDCITDRTRALIS